MFLINQIWFLMNAHLSLYTVLNLTKARTRSKFFSFPSQKVHKYPYIVHSVSLQHLKMGFSQFFVKQMKLNKNDVQVRTIAETAKLGKSSQNTCFYGNFFIKTPQQKKQRKTTETGQRLKNTLPWALTPSSALLKTQLSWYTLLKIAKLLAKVTTFPVCLRFQRYSHALRAYWSHTSAGLFLFWPEK